MKKPNYTELQEIVLPAVINALAEFSRSEHNINVYAVVLDTNEDYGSVILSINNLAGLSKTIESTYSHYTEEQINGLTGLKYNSGDFSFIDICVFPESLDKWADNYVSYLDSLKSQKAYDSNLERFSDAIATVISELGEAIDKLNKTPNFIAYHCFHDVGPDTVASLIKKTVNEELFDSVFPEIKEYEEFLRNIDSLEVADQTTIWLDLLDAYVTQTKQKYSAQFYNNNMYFDIRPQLVNIGKPALDKIIQYLDRWIFGPQINERGTKKRKEEGAFARESNAAHELLFVIADIGYVDKKVEDTLLHYIRHLQHEADKSEGIIGLNLCLSARCLYGLLPTTYPIDDMCVSTNRLLNSHAFIKDT